MNKNTFELGQTDMCHYLKLIAGYKFLYKKLVKNTNYIPIMVNIGKMTIY